MAKSSPSNLSLQQRYNNREVSWLAFNERVLAQAAREDLPLYERVRFLSISATNLDEFISVRMAGLKNQIRHDITIPSIDGLTPSEQLEIVQKLVARLMLAQQACWRKLLQALRAENIRIVTPKSLSAKRKAELHNYFEIEILPLLTPIAVDPAHPFPMIAHRGICFACRAIRARDAHHLNVLIPLPEALPRFITLSKGVFLKLEAVISWHFSTLMQGCTILEEGVFRIARDSDFELEDEADDFV
ncbi:MAG: RNA degradosome polyphosphate kinase, partial [Pseudomonadota bacterium]